MPPPPAQGAGLVAAASLQSHCTEPCLARARIHHASRRLSITIRQMRSNVAWRHGLQRRLRTTTRRHEWSLCGFQQQYWLSPPHDGREALPKTIGGGDVTFGTMSGVGKFKCNLRRRANHFEKSGIIGTQDFRMTRHSALARATVAQARQPAYALPERRRNPGLPAQRLPQ